MSSGCVVSVIMPVYNSCEFVGQAIKSVLDQSYENFELILVDDGSTDGSAEICKQYAKDDKRVKYFYQQNCGVSAARNFGIKRAVGEYVVFVDSDDYISRGLLNGLIQNAGEKLVGCEVFLVDGNKKQKRLARDRTYSVDNFLRNFLESKVQGFVFGFLFDHKKCPNFNSDTGYCEDVVFLADYMKKNSIKQVTFLENEKYYYRENANSVTKDHSELRKRFSDIRVSMNALRGEINECFMELINNKEVELFEHEIVHTDKHSITKNILIDFPIGQYTGSKFRFRIFSKYYRRKDVVGVIWYRSIVRMIKRIRGTL